MSNTPSVYPNAIDDHLRIPLRPTVARLSESEDPASWGLPEAKNENSHSDLHHAENNSIKKIQRHVLVDDSVSSHDHSDPYDIDYSSEYYQTHPTTKKGRRLRVQNTHVFTDNTNPDAIEAGPPDESAETIHHSVGTDDNLGEFQAVSGRLWRKKHMDDVPDSMFEDLDHLGDEWNRGEYPGDNLKDILLAIVAYINMLEQKIEDTKDELENQISDLDSNTKKMIQNILNKIWGGATLNPDGTINWGKGQNMKIPMADLNIFSTANPNNSTTANSIRSRDNITNNDIKAQ